MFKDSVQHKAGKLGGGGGRGVGSQAGNLLGEVEFAEDVICILQHFVHIVHSVRVALQGKVDERHLE